MSYGHVLVVDDEPEIVEELCEFLIARGHAVLGASCVPDAIRLLAQVKDITTVISDFRMPGLSGLDLLRACRSEEGLGQGPLHFFLMTGQTELTESALQEIESSGATLVAKPIGPRKLLEMLNEGVPA